MERRGTERPSEGRGDNRRVRGLRAVPVSLQFCGRGSAEALAPTDGHHRCLADQRGDGRLRGVVGLVGVKQPTVISFKIMQHMMWIA